MSHLMMSRLPEWIHLCNVHLEVLDFEFTKVTQISKHGGDKCQKVLWSNTRFFPSSHVGLRNGNLADDVL